jgi:hypothetical protein
MKKTDGDRTVRVEVTLPGSGILVTLARVPTLALKVLRGRVTAGRAWYRLEMSGRNDAVARALGVLKGASLAAS